MGTRGLNCCSLFPRILTHDHLGGFRIKLAVCALFACIANQNTFLFWWEWHVVGQDDISLLWYTALVNTPPETSQEKGPLRKTRMTSRLWDRVRGEMRDLSKGINVSQHLRVGRHSSHFCAIALYLYQGRSTGHYRKPGYGFTTVLAKWHTGGQAALLEGNEPWGGCRSGSR